MHFLDTLNPEQREAVLHIEGPAADPRRRRVRARRASSPAASPTWSATATRSRTRSSRSPSPTRRRRRCAARVEALLGADCSRHVGLDVPLALRAAAAARGAGHRPVARLRHLRLVRPAHRRQAGAQGAAHRRQLRAAARGAVAHQPREEPDGEPGGRWPAAAGWNRRDEQIAKVYALLPERAEGQQRARLRRSAAEDRRSVRAVRARPRRSTPSSSGS